MLCMKHNRLVANIYDFLKILLVGLNRYFNRVDERTVGRYAVESCGTYVVCVKNCVIIIVALRRNGEYFLI